MIQSVLAAIIAGSLTYLVLAGLVFLYEHVRQTKTPRHIHWGAIVAGILVAVATYLNYLGR